MKYCSLSRILAFALGISFYLPLLCSAEEVSVTIEGKSLKGSLDTVAGNNTTVAFILSGSGPTDRDGNSAGVPGKNDSLKSLSAYLNKKGFSTLRVDKRGIAASKLAEISEKNLRFSTYIDDTVHWIKFLEQKNYQKIILIGHSEGALVATMAAAKHSKVTKLITLAGAGLPAPVILRKQLKPKLPPVIYQLADKIITSLTNGEEVQDLPKSLQALFRPSVQPYLISWFRIDPAVEIAKLKIPTLIIQGTTDLQVSPDSAKLLHKSSPQSQLKIIKGMNHVLKDAKGDINAQLPSYLNPDLPLHPDLGAAVMTFLK